MNERAANALYEAERNGVRQARGDAFGEGGAMCATMVLVRLKDPYTLTRIDGCPLCGAKDYQTLRTRQTWRIDCEHRLVIHMNDHHGMSFAEIARKLGPDAA